MATSQHTSIKNIPLIKSCEPVIYDEAVKSVYLAGKNGEAVAEAAYKNSQQVRTSRISAN